MYVGGTEAGLRDFYAFMNQALDWGEPARYSILDTFLSDSMSVNLLEQMLRKSSQHHPVRILLADPTSNFAIARGASIAQDALFESCQGVNSIRQALERVRAGQPRGRPLIPTGTGEQIEYVSLALDGIRAHELAHLVEVKLYSDAPSGPLYFFGDIVVCGRFAAGSSSIDMPWSMVVDHPLFDRDYFAALEQEFDHIWDQAAVSIGASSPTDGGVFLSYADLDLGLASGLCDLLQAGGLSTFMAQRHVRVSDNWQEVLRLHLASRSVFIALLTPAGCRSEWVRNEIAGAWALGKAIVPAICGVDDADVPELAAACQGVKIAGRIDAQAVFNAVAPCLGIAPYVG
jgi:hypothetical protein